VVVLTALAHWQSHIENCIEEILVCRPEKLEEAGVFRVFRLARTSSCRRNSVLLVVAENKSLHMAGLGGAVSLDDVHRGETQQRRQDSDSPRKATELVVVVVLMNQTNYSREEAVLVEASVQFPSVVYTYPQLLLGRLHTVLSSGRSLASEMRKLSQHSLRAGSPNIVNASEILVCSLVCIDPGVVRRRAFFHEEEC
jgi:hypothetical protein